jgi:hypothetical protein
MNKSTANNFYTQTEQKDGAESIERKSSAWSQKRVEGRGNMTK